MSIQSVERAFEILKAIAQSPSSAELAEIAHATGLPKSTVVRMLTTLEQIEAVQRTHNQYRIGQTIANLLTTPSTLLEIATPRLQHLAQTTGETASLAVMDGMQLHYIAQFSDPTNNIQIRDWTGIRVPMLHIASPGKLFLAFDEAIYQQYMTKPLERYTERTITETAVLQQALQQIRAQGYAWVREEFERGLSGVSAPIFNINGQIIAALNLYGPSFRIPDQANELNFSQQVVLTAKEICILLGNRKESVFRGQ